jgi:hypothetical protein
MEISLKLNHGSAYLKVEADNVRIEEHISETIYGVKEDGTKDFSQRFGYDISDEYLTQLERVLEDMFYYRVKEYDSNGLIRQAFNKLPEDVKKDMLKELNETHGL